MSFKLDHAKWLDEQGVRILDRSTVRRILPMPYSYQADEQFDSRSLKTIEETVYKVELTEKVIVRFERNELAIQDAIDYVAKKHGYNSYLNKNCYSEFYSDNSDRHAELLKDNQMYSDAWKEFQSIRALLGETTTWP